MTDNALYQQDCPALMSDGRHVTDYRPSCYVHDLILKQNGIRNSHQMRHFLQNNADALMKVNTDYARTKTSCSCKYEHIDPNKNDEYHNALKSYLGLKK